MPSADDEIGKSFRARGLEVQAHPMIEGTFLSLILIIQLYFKILFIDAQGWGLARVATRWELMWRLIKVIEGWRARMLLLIKEHRRCNLLIPSPGAA